MELVSEGRLERKGIQSVAQFIETRFGFLSVFTGMIASAADTRRPEPLVFWVLQSGDSGQFYSSKSRRI